MPAHAPASGDHALPTVRQHVVPVPPVFDESADQGMQAFEQALAQVERLRARLADLDSLGQAHWQASDAQLRPLRQALHSQWREAVECLDDGLAALPLSRTQRATAVRELCWRAAALAEAGQSDMAAVHDAHSPTALAALRARQAQAQRDAQAERVRDIWRAWWGEEMPPLAGISPEEALRTRWAQHQAHTQAQRQAKAEARQARRQARAARQAQESAGANQAMHANADAGHDTANSTIDSATDSTTGQSVAAASPTLPPLRVLYRQLAAALHPDREPDPALQRQKAQWMAEANVAYDRGDLPTLLRLRERARLTRNQPDQLRLEADAARLPALTHLLREQFADLERQRQALEQRWRVTLGVPDGCKLRADALADWLAQQVQSAQSELAQATQDAEQLNNAQTFRAWLNARGSGVSG